MSESDLVSWVRGRVREGYSKEQLRSYLLSHGYREADVERAIGGTGSTLKVFIFISLIVSVVVFGFIIHFFFFDDGPSSINDNPSSNISNVGENSSLDQPLSNVSENVSVVSYGDPECLDLEKDGLVVVRSGVDGEDFARNLASNRGWMFLAVDSSETSQIRAQINQAYQQEEFNYLLLIGTNEELPFAVLNEGFIEGDTEGGAYQTDSYLYGDLDEDGFMDLSIGRLPFSSEEWLTEYYSDLCPKGNNHFFEFYPFSRSGNDPLDENTVKGFEYANCVASHINGMEVSRNSGYSKLVQNYRGATFLELNTHGSPKGFQVNQDFFTISSLCSGCVDGNCDCSEEEYLNNRPILIHLSCSNAQELGVDLVRNGASAFVGAYVDSGGTSPLLTQSVLTGKSVGDSLKELINLDILRSRIVLEPGYEPSVGGIDGINNFDISEIENNENYYGRILYGDPALRLSDPLEDLDPVTYNVVDNVIELDVSSSDIFDVYSKDKLLCYTGSAIDNPSYINLDYWGEDTNFGKAHLLHLGLLLDGEIDQIESVSAIVDGSEVFLPSNEVGEIFYGEFRANLVKGSDQAALRLLIQDSQLPYDKPVKIKIDYS